MGTPSGETYSFSGRHYALSDSPALPKPAQAGGPPIIIGGFGAKRTPRLAARYADEYNVPFHQVKDTAGAFDRVRAACAEAGRTRPLVYSAAQVVCCGRDEAELKRRADAIGREVSELRGNGLAGTPGSWSTRSASSASWAPSASTCRFSTCTILTTWSCWRRRC